MIIIQKEILNDEQNTCRNFAVTSTSENKVCARQVTMIGLRFKQLFFSDRSYIYVPALQLHFLCNKLITCIRTKSKINTFNVGTIKMIIVTVLNSVK